MDAQLKAKWVEALRSGEFKQASQTLQDGFGANCCLGVLARIQGENLNDWSEGDREISCLASHLSGGLDAEVMLRLARMNDGGLNKTQPSSFPEIADYIEANVPAD